MCLRQLVEFKVTRGYGWQIFRKGRTGLLQLHCHSDYPQTPVVEGMWQTDPNNYYIRPGCGFDTYKTGFHIMLEWEDILDYIAGLSEKVIRKVWFRDVVATGVDDLNIAYPIRSAKVVVARERFVEPKKYRRV